MNLLKLARRVKCRVRWWVLDRTRRLRSIPRDVRLYRLTGAWPVREGRRS